MAKRLLILDLDGTLVNTEARFNECQKIAGGNKRVFWECFQSERFMHLDTPNQKVVDFVKSLVDPGTVIIVVSGRSETQYNKTIEQLAKIGITPNEIYMRKKGDFRKDFEFKTAILRELLERYKPEKAILIDDSDEVLKKTKENFPGVEVIDAKTLY